MPNLNKTDRAAVIAGISVSESGALLRQTRKVLKARDEYIRFIEGLLRHVGVTTSGMTSGEIERSGLLLYGDAYGVPDEVRDALKAMK